MNYEDYKLLGSLRSYDAKPNPNKENEHFILDDIYIRRDGKLFIFTTFYLHLPIVIPENIYPFYPF